ncbi:MAG TPA: methionyl-tRNA formyltransferase, partial [Actinomycetota bacterium]|nr:methionyl-tRNA formyltransferase [Actinomycetota bacterium]
MRTVFFGTPAWAVPSLRALVESPVEVAAVVTNPDKPAGRGMELRPSPVKEEALRHGLEVLQPLRAREPELHERLAAVAPDVAVVVAYGSILPGPLLEVPRLGFVNLHFSLLPAYRGAAPVPRAVMDGVDVSGVSIMVLTEGMD